MRRQPTVMKQHQRCEQKKNAWVLVHGQITHTVETAGRVIKSESSFKRFVTFYITNFPPQASTFFLRKGFEVCGILEDVFVANNRNTNGEVYGFVRYAKVRDVDKLLKSLNTVCFGQYCVCVVLARFDKKKPRKEVKEGVKVREGGGVGGKALGKVVGEGVGEIGRVRVQVPEGEKRVSHGAGRVGEG